MADFRRVMKERFIDGKEKHFDYSKVDDDSDLDDLETMGRDAEERYFDED